MKPSVRLTAAQYRLLGRHARMLPPAERDMFCHSVVSRLRGEPTLAAVEAACIAALDLRPMFMCDSATVKEGDQPDETKI
jgi:hypothetical protein